MLGKFENPTIIWNIINYITKLLEKNITHSEGIISSFNMLNIHNILNLKSSLVDEAIIDMMKNLFVIVPNSDIVLDICVKIIDFQL